MQPLDPRTHPARSEFSQPNPTQPRDKARVRECVRSKESKISPVHHATTSNIYSSPDPRGLDSPVSATTVRALRPPNATTAMSSSLLSSLSSLGLGYSIAIALGFLVLLASLLLAFYFCLGRGGGGGDYWAGEAVTTASSSGHLSITVPRVLFVAEGSESPDDAAYSSASAAAAAACSPVGLDAAAIASYPKVAFSGRAAEADAMCSICLSEYRDGEMLRVMPECRHGFHVACLDAWLRRSASCPVCRSSPIPTPNATPLATPLSELVPLSQYAADRRRRR